MIKKQKICTITALALFVIAAGTIEKSWLISALCVIGMAAAVLIGGLDQKRTNYEEIRKDYRI